MLMIKRILRKSPEDKQAQLEHERLTSLVNSMADGVLAIDENMEIVLSNGAALNILDVNSTLKGRRLGEVMYLEDRNKRKVDVEKLISGITTATTNRDLLLRYQDNSTLNLYLSIAPVHLGYGTAGQQGYVLLMRDITHEKSLEEERDEFISVVSHELRTPIAIAEGNISNALFIAEKTGDISQIKQALEEAHHQVVFLAEMINDLSTLSRAERGKLTVEVEDIDVPALIAELKTSYTPQATQKNLWLKAEVATDVKTLQSSSLYVREILQNFITNAIKYTEEGGVTIKAEPGQGGVRFLVIDTGIGISKGDQERIFDKFFRSEDYRTRKTNGTGLGLYVTMKLANLIHAEIDVQSELNKGSTFTIFIPDLGE
jgi:PAS domain S-box